MVNRSFEASKLRSFEAFVTEIEISILGFENSTLFVTSNEFEAFEVQPDKFKAVRNSFQQYLGTVQNYLSNINNNSKTFWYIQINLWAYPLFCHMVTYVFPLLLLFHNDGGIRRSFWLKTCHVFHQTSLFVPLLRKGLDLLSHCVQHVFLQFYTSWSPLRQIWSAADDKQ